MKKILVFFAFLVLLLYSSTLEAYEYTYTFSGWIGNNYNGQHNLNEYENSGMPVLASSPILEPYFSSVNLITGSIIYDTEKIDQDLATDTGTYRGGTLIVNLPEIGVTMVGATNSMQLSIWNNVSSSYDGFGIFSSITSYTGSTSTGGFSPYYFSVNLYGATSMVSTTDLPTGPLDWHTGNLNIDFNIAGADVEHRQIFAVFSPTASPIPIPGAVWLLGSGIVGLAALRRKVQK